MIEAVFENLEVKKKVFAELDKNAPPHAILASNTSGLSIIGMLLQQKVRKRLRACASSTSSRYEACWSCKAGRDWFKDILKFAADLHGRPPKSAPALIAGVKSWLEFSLDVELSGKQMRLLHGGLPKGSKARTEEAELTKEVLRKILTHTDAKGKALFLFLASSGIRVGEALKLRLNDVNLNVDPPEVYVRGEYTKSGDKYSSFLQ